MAERLPARIPTALALPFFVRNLTHQGMKRASLTVSDGEQDCAGEGKVLTSLHLQLHFTSSSSYVSSHPKTLIAPLCLASFCPSSSCFQQIQLYPAFVYVSHDPIYTWHLTQP